MTDPDKPRCDAVLKHAVMRGQLIALMGRWQQLAGRQGPAWARSGRYNRGYCAAYEAAIRDLTEVLDGDE